MQNHDQKLQVLTQLQRYQAKYPFLFADPTTDEEIQELETYAGWKLPTEYVELLCFSSGIQLKYSIYGTNAVETMDNSINTVVSATEFYKKYGYVLKNCLVVSDDPTLEIPLSYIKVVRWNCFRTTTGKSTVGRIFGSFWTAFCLIRAKNCNFG